MESAHLDAKSLTSPPMRHAGLVRVFWKSVWVLAVAAILWLSSGSAAAHGPCLCLSPSSGAPGTRVQTPSSYHSVEVLWNPDPRELINPALLGSKWGRLFQPDLRTISLARQEEPGAMNFQVPHVPDGRYLVVMFDLGEGGPRHHYTWDTFTVARSAPMPVTGQRTAEWLTLALVLLSAGAITLRCGRLGHT